MKTSLLLGVLVALLLFALGFSCEDPYCARSTIVNDTDKRVVVIVYNNNSVDTFARLEPKAKSTSFEQYYRAKVPTPPTAYREIGSFSDSLYIVFNDTHYLRYSAKETGCGTKSPMCNEHYDLVREEGGLGFFEYHVTQGDFETAKPY